ncbi:MAG: succinylglutamate desuccinylase/aspartoacylase family protein [Candidatus Binatia bacterium]
MWVRPGRRRSFVFDLVESYGGDDVSIPVTMIRGAKPGPTLLLTSTIHGDELNGLPILLQLRERISASRLNGLVIMLPVVNPYGFERQTRYLPDRRDLNRYFPGNPRGSLANRIAHRIFQTFVLPSDFLIDFHTAAGGRSNAPHVRADPASAEARSLAQGFGGIVVLQSAAPHTLRHAATEAGVPTAVFEGGENGRLDAKSVESGVRGVENVLASLGMLSEGERNQAKPLWMKYSPWIRANTGGIVELAVGLGDLVQENQLLLTIRETVQGRRTEVRAPTPGIVMAVARSPVADPGYALIRLGIIQSDVDVAPQPEVEEEVPE